METHEEDVPATTCTCTAPLLPQSQPQRTTSLIPDYIDDDNNQSSNNNSNNNSDYVISPSFRDIRRKTLRSLYGIEDETLKTTNTSTSTSTSTNTINHKLLMDKSPKGSVDEGIRSLVDLINAHPSYATLSSCSGRITLFDPMAMSTNTCTSSGTLEGGYDHDNDNVNDNDNDNDNDNIDTDTNTKENTNENDNINENETDDKGGESSSEDTKEVEGDKNDNDTNHNNKTNKSTNSGKGFGSWRISSHATITTNHLINELNNHAKSRHGNGGGGTGTSTDKDNNAHYALMFKHEPLLLHIAASNISRARQLLTIACNLGFRESGLIVTPKRITVAIRSHALSLAIPLASSGGLRPSDVYINGIVNEANERFILNGIILMKLEEQVRENLFQCSKAGSLRVIQQGGEEDDMNQSSQSLNSFHISGSSLPDLNLWGHSAVCVPISGEKSSTDVDLIVVGGYGAGPVIVPTESLSLIPNKRTTKHCARSNKVFRLRRTNQIWDKSWKELQQKEVPIITVTDGEKEEIEHNSKRRALILYSTAGESESESEFHLQFGSHDTSHCNIWWTSRSVAPYK